MLETKESKPFKWLHNTDNSYLAFALVDPLVFFTENRIIPNPEDLTEIKESDLKELKIYIIVTLYPDLLQTSANLIAPLIFNLKKIWANEESYPNRPIIPGIFYFENELKRTLKTVPAFT